LNFLSAWKHALAALDPPQIEYHALLAGGEAAVAPFLATGGGRLLEITRAVSGRGAPVLPMAFPMEVAICGPPVSPTPSGRLADFCTPTGMPFVTLEPPYRQAPEGRNPFLPYDLHPSAHVVQTATEHMHQATVHAGWPQASD